MFRLIFVLFLLINGFLWGQNAYPKDYFAMPMELPLILSGNFGELRPNHFHAGIDIKTNGVQGIPVYAAAEGVVRRIKVSTGGYGKVLYVEHPNGYTSVYAHLQKFAPEIEKYVKKAQYAKKIYEIELFPKKDELKVKQLELIGLSGNTGGSAAPHLHFEIRETQSQNTINPRFFGYNVADTIAPKVYRVYAYAISEDKYLQDDYILKEFKLHALPNNQYVTDTLQTLGKIGFGVQSIDKQNGTQNTYGLYEVDLEVNEKPHLSYVFNKMDFLEDTYINMLIDYALYVDQSSRVQLLYKKPSNKLSLYTNMENNGVIQIDENQDYSVVISLKDFNGNKTQVKIPIKGIKTQPIVKETDPSGIFLQAKNDFSYKTQTKEIFFPKNTFYENVVLQITEQKDTLQVLPMQVPVRKSYSISFKKEKNKENNYKKTLIAWVNDKDGSLSCYNTLNKDEYLTAKVRAMGRFVLVQDTIAPKITFLTKNKPNKMSNLQTIKAKIDDELSGVKGYSATINGKWVLMEYEPKEKMLTLDISDLTDKDLINIGTQKELRLSIRVWDKANNTNTQTFLWQQ